MSSSILSLKTLLISSRNLKCAARRRHYCHTTTASPPPSEQQKQLHLHLQKLGQSLIPNVVVLESHFSPPTNKLDLHHCPRLATAFFLTPTLLATSALAVADVSPSTAFQYEAHIARTIAFTPQGAALPTRPLAVSFAEGVAVLEVVDPETSRRGCVLSESSPDKDSIIVAVSPPRGGGFGLMIGNVRGGGGVDAKAPWPLSDELGWMEHGWCGVGIGDPAPGSDVISAVSEGSATRIMGSPWLNLEGEVVGIASWEVKDEAGEFSVGFAAPASSIRVVADYVKNKDATTPLVMDTWIHAHVFYGD